jgi:dienelactone hydrolase
MKPVTGSLVGLVLILSAFALPSPCAGQADTLITLPAPTGPHPVGTRTWYWVDRARQDALTREPDDFRGLMVQLWYPRANVDHGEVAPFMPLYGWHQNVRGHSVADAQVAKTVPTMPVVLLCPGRGTSRHYYTSVAEDLASHGYAVVGIDSPHSGLVVYPDGRYVAPNPKYKPSTELMSGSYEKVDEFFSEAAELGRLDVAFVLREIEHLNTVDGSLSGRLDLARIGVFGHSLGGRIAGAAAGSDSRIRAYVAMEGVPPRDVRRGGMDAAVAMLMSGGFPPVAEANVKEVVPLRRNDVVLVRLNGFSHNSVTDEPLIEPSTPAPELSPTAALAFTRRFLRSFFDRYLRADTDALNWLEQENVQAQWFPKP